MVFRSRHANPKGALFPWSLYLQALGMTSYRPDASQCTKNCELSHFLMQRPIDSEKSESKSTTPKHLIIPVSCFTILTSMFQIQIWPWISRIFVGMVNKHAPCLMVRLTSVQICVCLFAHLGGTVSWSTDTYIQRSIGTGKILTLSFLDGHENGTSNSKPHMLHVCNMYLHMAWIYDRWR